MPNIKSSINIKLDIWGSRISHDSLSNFLYASHILVFLRPDRHAKGAKNKTEEIAPRSCCLCFSYRADTEIRFKPQLFAAAFTAKAFRVGRQAGLVSVATVAMPSQSRSVSRCRGQHQHECKWYCPWWPVGTTDFLPNGRLMHFVAHRGTGGVFMAPRTNLGYDRRPLCSRQQGPHKTLCQAQPFRGGRSR